MSSSNHQQAPPTVYHAKKTKRPATAASQNADTLLAPLPRQRPSTKTAAPARKGQLRAFNTLNPAKQLGSAVPLSASGMSAVRLGPSSKARSSELDGKGTLDLTSLEDGQMLWYRYKTPSPLWVPVKVFRVDASPHRADTSVTFYLPHSSSMDTIMQAKLYEEPVLELFEPNCELYTTNLKKTVSAFGAALATKSLAQKALDKLNGEWGKPSGLSSGGGGLASLSGHASLSYKLRPSVSSVEKASAARQPRATGKSGSAAGAESDLSDLDSLEGEAPNGKATASTSRKRASSPSAASNSASISTSAPSKKARLEPEKPGTGISTITFTRRAAASRMTATLDDLCAEPRAVTSAFSQESLMSSLTPDDLQEPVYSGSESDSDMDIPGIGPLSTRPSHLELSVPVGISVLAHRSDSHHGSRFAPARVIGYADNDLVSVRFYDGQDNPRLPRSEMLIIGDAEFGAANMETIPELPPVPRGYRNPLLEARVKAVLPALDDIVRGKRASPRVALYEKSLSSRAIDRRGAETELAGRLGGEPYSKAESKLIRRVLEARYVLGIAGLAEELEQVVGSQGNDNIDMPSSSQGRRNTAKGKGKGKVPDASKTDGEQFRIPPDRTRRSRKEVATYAESSSESDSDVEFVKERDEDGNSVPASSTSQDRSPPAHTSLLTSPRILSEAELTSAPSLESTFPSPLPSLPRKDQRFVDLVLYPECLARLIVLTHLTNERTGVIAGTRIRSTGGLSDDMDMDTAGPITVSSSQSQSQSHTNASIPDWRLRAMKQFKLDSDQYNDPRAWKTVPEVTVQYGLSADEEAEVLPKAEELLRDCHWMQALLLLKRSNSGHGKGHGRGRR